MDIQLLLATEPSSTYNDPAARSLEIISFSTGKIHSAHTTSTTSAAAPQLRRDTVRVHQGIFDRRSKSRWASPMAGFPPPVRSSMPAISDAMAISITSSFSYTPLPDDDYSREADYDDSAAYDYPNSLDSESESKVEGPETSPLDYMGTGTPIFTPRLMAKILRAKAAGRPLQVSNSNVQARKIKNKERKKGDGKRKDKARNCAGPEGGRRASVRSKQSREDESDDEHWRRKEGRHSDASNRPTANEPTVKRPKGWRGWALVEVSSSEDEKAGIKLYDADGRLIQHADDEESELNSANKPGWKGWALVENSPDRSKLIKLDAPPLILPSRATRSGRTFGDANIKRSVGSTSGIYL